jgi:adenylate kinase family enzyme
VGAHLLIDKDHVSDSLRSRSCRSRIRAQPGVHLIPTRRLPWTTSGSAAIALAGCSLSSKARARAFGLAAITDVEVARRIALGVSGNNPVLIVTGPPGSGKTTTARAIAGRRDRAAHVESDRFFHFIETGYVEPWRPESHEQNRVVMRIVADAAGGYANAGYFTIVDGIVSPRWFFEPLRNRLAGLGHAVAYAVLRPSLDVCIARVVGRASDRLGDPSVVEQLWRDFADLGHLERHVIETDELSVEETADVLASRLSDGLLLT